MSLPWYVFPPDVHHDTGVAIHDTAGWTLTSRPTTHPVSGAACQVFDIPDGTPDKNGCSLQITNVHGKPYYAKPFHGALYLTVPDLVGAWLLVDIFPAGVPMATLPRLVLNGDVLKQDMP